MPGPATYQPISKTVWEVICVTGSQAPTMSCEASNAAFADRCQAPLQHTLQPVAHHPCRLMIFGNFLV